MTSFLILPCGLSRQGCQHGVILQRTPIFNAGLKKKKSPPPHAVPQINCRWSEQEPDPTWAVVEGGHFILPPHVNPIWLFGREVLFTLRNLHQLSSPQQGLHIIKPNALRVLPQTDLLGTEWKHTLLVRQCKDFTLAPLLQRLCLR